ncbi:hypothetical protein SDC9_185854 [bioreactor metagenome]|uniref:Uncharacterized protein n=1 Tax=bioreactor metagenome TaxID=1076179 RepID=A0A645HHX0_9ZZZZ
MNCLGCMAVLGVGKHQCRSELLSDILLFAVRQLPIDTVFILYPSVFSTPWIFVEFHQHRTSLQQTIPDIINFFFRITNYKE